MENASSHIDMENTPHNKVVEGRFGKTLSYPDQTIKFIDFANYFKIAVLENNS